MYLYPCTIWEIHIVLHTLWMIWYQIQVKVSFLFFFSLLWVTHPWVTSFPHLRQRENIFQTFFFFCGLDFDCHTVLSGICADLQFFNCNISFVWPLFLLLCWINCCSSPYLSLLLQYLVPRSALSISGWFFWFHSSVWSCLIWKLFWEMISVSVYLVWNWYYYILWLNNYSSLVYGWCCGALDVCEFLSPKVCSRR